MELVLSEESKKIYSKPPILNSLTGIRAIGAWWIVLFHMRSEISNLSENTSFLQHFIQAGHIGVTLFFVLSGFILSYNYSKKFTVFDKLNYFNFICQRLARVYPVHITTLLFFLVLVAVANLTGHSFDSPERYSIFKFIKHIFLVNAWSLPIETSWNGVAWTLSLEWLCYLFFPLLAILTSRATAPQVNLFMITLIIVVTIFLQPPGGIYEILMFIEGVFLGRLYLSQFGKYIRWEIITIISFLLILCIGSSLSLLNLRTSTISGFVILLIYSLAWSRNLTHTVFGSSIMTYWGYTSYSLYMTHPISLRIFRMFLPIESFKSMNQFECLCIISSEIVIISLVARLMYSCIEEPSRKWIKTKIDQSYLRLSRV